MKPAPIISEEKRSFTGLRLIATFFGGLRVEVAKQVLVIQIIIWFLPFIIILPPAPTETTEDFIDFPERTSDAEGSFLPTSIALFRSCAGCGITLLTFLLSLCGRSPNNGGPTWFGADLEIEEDIRNDWRASLATIFPKRKWYDLCTGLVITFLFIFAVTYRLEVDQVPAGLRFFACIGIASALFNVSLNRECPEVAVWHYDLFWQRVLTVILLVALPGNAFAIITGLLPFLWLGGLISFLPLVHWVLEQGDRFLGGSPSGGLIIRLGVQYGVTTLGIVIGWYSPAVGPFLASLIANSNFIRQNKPTVGWIVSLFGILIGSCRPFIIHDDKRSMNYVRLTLEMFVLISWIVCISRQWTTTFSHTLVIHKFSICLLGAALCLETTSDEVTYTILQLCGIVAISRASCEWWWMPVTLIFVRILDHTMLWAMTDEIPFTFRVAAARMILHKLAAHRKQIQYVRILVESLCKSPKLYVKWSLSTLPLCWISTFVSLITENPWTPLFTLPIFCATFPQPKHMYTTPYESERRESLIYQTMVPSMMIELKKILQQGIIDPSECGFYLFRSHERLISIVEILGYGHGWVDVQIRGLEMQEPTSCHHVEAMEIDEYLSKVTIAPCLKSKFLPCFTSCKESKGDNDIEARKWIDQDPGNQEREKERQSAPKLPLYMWPKTNIQLKAYETTSFRTTGLLDSPDGNKLLYQVFAHSLLLIFMLELESPEVAVMHPNEKFYNFISDAVIQKILQYTQSQDSVVSPSGIHVDMKTLTDYNISRNKITGVDDIIKTLKKHVTLSDYFKKKSFHHGSTASSIDNILRTSYQTNDRASTPGGASIIGEEIIDSATFDSTKMKKQTSTKKIFADPLPPIILDAPVSVIIRDKHSNIRHLDNKPSIESVADEQLDELLRQVLTEGVHSAPPDDRSLKAKFFDESIAQLAFSCYVIATLGLDPKDLSMDHTVTLFEGKHDLFESNPLFHHIVSRSFRAAVKVTIGLLSMGETITSELTELILEAVYDTSCVPYDSPEIIKCMRENRNEIFSLHMASANQVMATRTVLLDDVARCAQLSTTNVTGIWNATKMELQYMSNDDEERYSIQAHPRLLRNLLVQALEYPVYVSPVHTIQF